MSMSNKCQGCGAVLQVEDPSKVGFVLSLDHEYCQACYRLLHYGESIKHFHPEDLPSLNKDSLIIMVSSVLHLDLLFTYPVYRYQADANYVYIINQIDLLPKSTNLELLIANITLKAKRMNIPYIDIILMSAKNTYDIENLKKYIVSFKHPDIYLLGVQNSGKTTLYNALTNQTKALAFKKAGLTQEALSIKIGKQTLWDMPGLYQEGYLHQMLPYQVYKNLIPDEEIFPKIYQLKTNQTLFIEGLVALSVKGNPTSVILYMHRMIKIHKTNETRIKDLLLHKEEQFKIFVSEYEEKSFRIPDGKYQITFADMGFMHVVGPNNIKLTHPKGMHISMTEALFQ